jgi:hypothetical protein
VAEPKTTRPTADRIDYTTWTFADHLTRALDTGQARVFCLGIGVDPLTFATDILTVLTVDAPIYDELFGQVADTNAEGSIIPAAYRDSMSSCSGVSSNVVSGK